MSSKLRETFNHSYTKFVFKKAIFYLLATFIALTFVFLIPRFMVETRSGFVVYFFGLDQPIEEQYFAFLNNLIRLDLGPSFSYYPRTVLETLFFPLLYTLILVVPVLFLSFFIGNWIGSKAAYLKNSRLNDIVYFILLCFRAAPFYWLGLMIFVYFVSGNNIFLAHPGGISPGVSRGFTLEFFIDSIRHYIPAFLTLLIVNVGFWAVRMRSLTLSEMESNYIHFADHLGFRNSTLRKYTQRNAILPQFTMLNLRFNELIGETLIVENILLWPGIGVLYMESIIGRDYPLIMGITIVFLLVAIVGNFIVDITYGFLDPRIKTGTIK
ncbi:MAG: ABC transporter permease [Candidatus Hodarchaeales archaeon]